MHMRARRAASDSLQKRFSLYSNPILSFDTGQRSAAAIMARSTREISTSRTRQQACPLHQVSAEQLVRAFPAQRHRGAAFGQPGKKPYRQCAGIRVRLIAVVSQFVIAPARSCSALRSSRYVRSHRFRHLARIVRSSKLRPRKLIEKVLSRVLDASAA